MCSHFVTNERTGIKISRESWSSDYQLWILIRADSGLISAFPGSWPWWAPHSPVWVSHCLPSAGPRSDQWDSLTRPGAETGGLISYKVWVTHDDHLQFLLHFCQLFKDYLFFPLFGISYGIYFRDLHILSFDMSCKNMKDLFLASTRSSRKANVRLFVSSFLRFFVRFKCV